MPSAFTRNNRCSSSGDAPSNSAGVEGPVLLVRLRNAPKRRGRARSAPDHLGEVEVVVGSMFIRRIRPMRGPAMRPGGSAQRCRLTVSSLRVLRCVSGRERLLAASRHRESPPRVVRTRRSCGFGRVRGLGRPFLSRESRRRDRRGAAAQPIYARAAHSSRPLASCTAHADWNSSSARSSHPRMAASNAIHMLPWPNMVAPFHATWSCHGSIRS